MDVSAVGAEAGAAAPGFVGHSVLARADGKVSFFGGRASQSRFVADVLVACPAALALRSPGGLSTPDASAAGKGRSRIAGLGVPPGFASPSGVAAQGGGGTL